MLDLLRGHVLVQLAKTGNLSSKRSLTLFSILHELMQTNAKCGTWCAKWHE